jgi:hypothetical protein
MIRELICLSFWWRPVVDYQGPGLSLKKRNDRNHQKFGKPEEAGTAARRGTGHDDYRLNSGLQ